MLTAELAAEVAAYVDQFNVLVHGNSRQLVVRNGYHHVHEVVTAASAWCS